MRKFSTQHLVLVAVFAAVLAVLSQITFPLPSGIPVTLQTFAVALCGFVLGSKMGFAATGVYLLMGTVGLPVFAGFVGGPGILMGVTGGFLWGFLAMAALCGLQKPHWAAVGLAVCHAAGILQYVVVTRTGIWQAFLLVSLPFLIKDGLSVGAAALAARVLRRSLAAARFSI